MNKIRNKDDPVLRKDAHEVKISEIKSDKIKSVIRRMKAALNKESDGVAIAAPQVGESLALFVVSHRVFEIIDEQAGTEQGEEKHKDLVFINPQIIKYSRDKSWMEEGCLSVRWLYGKVNRSNKIKIRAYNEQGVSFEIGASGLFAQVLQHETDHLNGILFSDKAKDLHELPDEEVKRITNKNNDK